MKEENKHIYKRIVVMMLIICMVIVNILTYVPAKIVNAAPTEYEQLTTEPGCEMVGETIGTATVLEEGVTLDDVARKQKMMRSSIGSSCYVAQGQYIDYFGWFTRKFSVQTETGTHMGYCAQPMLVPQPGYHTVSELNDDRIKAVLITNPFGPEPQAIWQQALQVANDDIRYGIAHALIGYYYTGGTEGFTNGGPGSAYHTIFVGMNNEMNAWRANNQDLVNQYTAYVARSGGQDIVWIEKNPTGYAALKKTSANPSITDGNKCYSLKGAEYGIYSDKECKKLVDTLITKEDGSSNTVALNEGTYYVKETKESEGYYKDETIYSITVKAGNTTTLNVKEEPKDDPAIVELFKLDKETGEIVSQGAASLAGAQFKICYYNDYYNLNNLPSKATRTWIIQTKEIKENGENRYLASLRQEYLVSSSSDELYKNNEQVVIPLGTITIEECKAPEGYLLEGGYLRPYGSTDTYSSKYIAQIKSEKDGAYLEGGNKYSVFDQVKRGDLKLIKIADGTHERLSDIPFKITSKTTGESHTIITDKNGQASTAASWNPHTQNTNEGKTSEDGVWFGEDDVDDKKGALVYDTYIIEEMPCKNNEGYKLIPPFEIVISENGTVVDLGTMTNDALVPTIGTTATDAITGEHFAYVDDETVFKDEVAYKDLVKGREYELEYTLMNADTKKAVEVNGKKVKGKMKFTAPNSEGTITAEIKFDSTGMEGVKTVVFEKLYYEGEVIAVHEDFTSEEQTITFVEPKISTNAVDKITGTHISYADGKVTHIDTVTYENLTPGREYELRATVMDAKAKKELTVAKEKVTGEKTFIPTEPNGTVDVTIEYDATGLEGLKTVIYEELYEKDGKEVIASHKDITDEKQTIIFAKPEIKTTAKDKETGLHFAYANEETTIIDTVSYKDLTIGREYDLVTIAMDKKTEKPIKDGKEDVTAKTSFKAEESAGAVDVKITFDTTKMKDKDIVIFEYLYGKDGELIASHEDINDEDQTVTILDPSVRTSAKDKDSGTQNAEADEMVTIVDTILLGGLIKGEEYTVEGILMDQASEEALLINNAEVRSEKTFTATDDEMKVEVEFTFDGSDLKGTSVVVFEELYYKGRVIAAHKDINDEGQTVVFEDIKISGNIDKKQTIAGDNKEYYYTIDYCSTSNTWADELIMEDPLDSVNDGYTKLVSIQTPVSFDDYDGKMNVWYQTNKNDKTDDSDAKKYNACSTNPFNPENKDNERMTDYTGWKIWKSDVSTLESTKLEVADLKLADGEYVTAIRFEHGRVQDHFTTRNDASENGELDTKKSEQDNLKEAVTPHKTVFNTAFSANPDLRVEKDIHYAPAVLKMEIISAEYKKGKIELWNTAEMKIYRNKGIEDDLYDDDKDKVVQKHPEPSVVKKVVSGVKTGDDGMISMMIALVVALTGLASLFATKSTTERPKR